MALVLIESNHKLGEALEDTVVDKRMHQKLVGKLIYLSHTRLDIAYTVGVVSQFMHNPKEVHLQAVVQVLQYLKRKPGKGILFRKGEKMSLEAYMDNRLCRFSSGQKVHLELLHISWRDSSNLEK